MKKWLIRQWFNLRWMKWFLLESPTIHDPLWAKWGRGYRKNPNFAQQKQRWLDREPRC